MQFVNILLSKGFLNDYLRECENSLVDLKDRSFLSYIFEVFNFSITPNATLNISPILPAVEFIALASEDTTKT